MTPGMTSELGRTAAPRAATHPCFHDGARGRHGRVHLPVARGCNIRCGYCDRRHDCVNESRPGVASSLLTPRQALARLEAALIRMPFVTVAGVAGPGDPFHDPEATLQTLALVRSARPDLHLCVSTNGLGIGPHVGDLVELGVGFVTLTVNAVDPDIGARIYERVAEGGRILAGREGAGLLLERQLSALSALKARGITVKVNMVVVPGVNDGHAPEVARRVGALGADRMNCIALLPVAGTALGHLPEPDARTMARIRDRAGAFLPQMRHCARCRADAAGLLGSSEGLGCAGEAAGC